MYRGKELVRGLKKSRKLRASFRLDGLRVFGVYWRFVLYENECSNECLDERLVSVCRCTPGLALISWNV